MTAHLMKEEIEAPTGSLGTGMYHEHARNFTIAGAAICQSVKALGRQLDFVV